MSLSLYFNRGMKADDERKLKLTINKNLCGRDGRTICGPQCVPKSTSVTLAGRKDVTDGNDNGTDGQTDRQSATHNAAPS